MTTNQWLSKINDGVPFGDLIIPGTHNSANDKMDFRFRTSNKLIQFAADTRILRGPIKRYGICQNQPLSTQLANGIRYFDIRVTKWKGVYYASHTFSTGIKLIEILDMFHEFLRENPREFLVLNMVPDWENRDRCHPAQIYKTWTSHEIFDRDFYNDFFTVGRPIKYHRGKIIWIQRRGEFKNHWFNKQKVRDLDDLISNGVHDHRLSILNYALTASSDEIMINILAVLIPILYTIFWVSSFWWAAYNVSGWIVFSGVVVTVIGALVHFLYRPSLKVMNESLPPKVYNDFNIQTTDFYTNEWLQNVIDKNLG